MQSRFPRAQGDVFTPRFVWPPIQILFAIIDGQKKTASIHIWEAGLVIISALKVTHNVISFNTSSHTVY